ncbi:MAG TPA: hypothetical protein VD839_13315 [Burkholderiales bacterium]|nr:hypothetical protein [Burkholderiales bacterium]
MPRLHAPSRWCRPVPGVVGIAGALVGGMLVTAQVVAQQASGDYATDLGVVYAGYQRIIALKEACDEAVPETRPANDRAFAAWQKRHAELLAELKRRVTAMIRRASRDEQEYTRNLGKYEGAILFSREEQKISFLTAGSDALRAQCQRAPELLKGPEGDLAVVFASELETIRKRK